MKLAILIVGEYRTFTHCRKTMQFLDQTDLAKDIYFSTWNITATDNPMRDKKTRIWKNPTREITTQEVQDALGVPAKIKIHDYNTVCPSRILSMRLGWQLGFEMIQKSKQAYDYVYLLRPDLFFRGKSKFVPNDFEKFENSVGFPAVITTEGEIDDTTFFSTFNNIEKLLDNALMNVDAESGNWHKMFADYIKSKNLNIGMIPMIDPNNLIGRFPMSSKTKFPTVEKNYLKRLHEHGA